MLAFLQNDVPVNDYGPDASGILKWLGKGGLIEDLLGIKNCDVGEISFF